jgi:predicted phage terminase large subunit-like protein
MLARDWEALFQQNPVPASGAFFKADFFKYYTEESRPPLHELAITVTWDISTGKSTDFSAGVVAGFHRDGNVYILDVINKRLTSLELTELILDTHKKWSAQRTGVEIGQISSTIDPILAKRMAERREYIAIDRLKPGRANKVARAMSIAGMMERGKVLFNKHAMWFGDLEAQMLAFPGGRNDDMVDALAYVAYIMSVVSPPQAVVPKPKKSWRDKLKKGKADGDTSWMSA